jgi:hypothetical protein
MKNTISNRSDVLHHINGGDLEGYDTQIVKRFSGLDSQSNWPIGTSSTMCSQIALFSLQQRATHGDETSWRFASH